MLTTRSDSQTAITWTMWDGQGRPTFRNMAHAFGPDCPAGWRPAGGDPRDRDHWIFRAESWDDLVAMFRQLAHDGAVYRVVGSPPRTLTPSSLDRLVVSEIAILRAAGVPVDAPDYDRWQRDRDQRIGAVEEQMDTITRWLRDELEENERERIAWERLAEWLRRQGDQPE